MKLVGLAAIFAIIGSSFYITAKQSKPLNTVKINIMPTPARTASVYVGAWVHGSWDNDKKTLNTKVVKDFEEDIGKKIAIMNMFSEWQYLENKNLVTDLNKISDNNWTPMISANPAFFDKCKKGNDSLYKTIASGACDEFLKSVGQNLKNYGKPVFLRFAWEMNLPNMYWSIKALKSTPQEFVEAWRHFHDVVRNEGATNVLWVLSFNTSSANTVPYVDLYPGDEYVDWVAIDGYNWGNTHPEWSRWTDFNGVFRNSYNELTAITNKPVMLSEVNSTPNGTGGNKSDWLQDMLEKQIPKNFPKVEAIVFFNENKTEGEKVDWRMEKSADYLKVLREHLNEPLYKSNYP
ncbi:MAG: glycosyl hydrolase [Patescibacteria group bacterium]